MNRKLRTCIGILKLSSILLYLYICIYFMTTKCIMTKNFYILLVEFKKSNDSIPVREIIFRYGTRYFQLVGLVQVHYYDTATYQVSYHMPLCRKATEMKSNAGRYTTRYLAWHHVGWPAVVDENALSIRVFHCFQQIGERILTLHLRLKI